jgi:hypothetical protein
MSANENVVKEKIIEEPKAKSEPLLPSYTFVKYNEKKLFEEETILENKEEGKKKPNRYPIRKRRQK